MGRFTVTTTTHPDGDLREGLTHGQAHDYASDLVEAGFAPEITRDGQAMSWDELLHWEG